MTDEYITAASGDMRESGGVSVIEVSCLVVAAGRDPAAVAGPAVDADPLCTRHCRGV
ncbi:MAG: hypothetical protein RRA94_08625 [Bacteroidota bacterium]|nr:hypothetical protein [Bacteroidota bacterium]